MTCHERPLRRGIGATIVRGPLYDLVSEGRIAVTKRSWQDLTEGQKIITIIFGAIQVGLLVAALWDLSRRSPEEVRGDRRMWAALVFINWIGPLAYFSIGRRPKAREEIEGEFAV
jgi:hypothetical protein